MRFLLLIGIIVFCMGCSHQKKAPPSGIPVTAFEVEPQTIPADFEFVGVTKSSHPVEIRARVEGYMMTIDYTEGSIVPANTLLFQLDPRQFEADLQAAKSIQARQEAILWRAQKNLDRMGPLFEKNAVSERDLDNAIAQVLAAEAEVIAAKAKVDLAELNLSYTQITSPIKGWTGRATYREGTLITPSVNGLLTYVSVIDPIWVYFSVTESELLQSRAETKAEQIILPSQQNYTVKLELSDGTWFPYTGRVNFTSPILDPDTGTMMVRATFSNPQDQLLPEMFVRAHVLGAFRPNALFVPQKSVVQGKKGKFVYVIDENNKVAARNVEVGSWFQNYWVILSGLQKGEKVVDEGVNKIQEGSSVQVTKVEKPPQFDLTPTSQEEDNAG